MSYPNYAKFNQYKNCCKPIGAQGLQGTQGATGLQGAQGATGLQGAQGDTGATGAQGDTGATGAQGDTGATGAQGATGADGTHTGAQGAAGTQGATPANRDVNMTLIGGTYLIDFATFLPAGRSNNNALPNTCNNFTYLEVKADLTNLGFSDNEIVYVPCYFRPS